MGWLERAARCHPKALAIALVIWHRAKLTGSGCVSVSVSRASMQMGFDRSQGHRAIQAMKKTGLVTVVQVAGKNTSVQLRWPPQS